MGDEKKVKAKKSKDKNGEKVVKEKVEKKLKEPEKIPVKSSKANSKANIDPRTGTRFTPGSARQTAFEIIMKAAKDGKNVRETRDILKSHKKENDKDIKYNLDPGYLNYTVAMHPEFFEVWDSGSVKHVKVIAEPKPDPEAAKKFEADRAARKEKAVKARKEKSGEKSDGKKKKKNKKSPEIKE